MVFLPSTGASGYNNCCIDGGTSPEYFGYNLVRHQRHIVSKTQPLKLCGKGKIPFPVKICVTLFLYFAGLIKSSPNVMIIVTFIILVSLLCLLM
jgi:hypothetical protein